MEVKMPTAEMVDMALLKPYKKNTKRHNQTQIDNVAESIRKFGFVQPFVIDKNNEVVIGHCRLLAAQKLGIKQLPCVRVDYLTAAQVKALRILDNKLNESEWDLDFLNEELPEIDLTGFDVDFDFADNEEQSSKERQDIGEVNFTNSLVIECQNENELSILFEEMQKRGYKCHISTL